MGFRKVDAKRRTGEDERSETFFQKGVDCVCGKQSVIVSLSVPNLQSVRLMEWRKGSEMAAPVSVLGSWAPAAANGAGRGLLMRCAPGKFAPPRFKGENGACLVKTDDLTSGAGPADDLDRTLVAERLDGHQEIRIVVPGRMGAVARR